MNRKWIKNVKLTKQLTLSGWQLLAHYFIVVILLIIPSIGLFKIYTKSYEATTIQEHMWFSWPWYVLAIIFYIIQKRRLKFIEVKIEFTDHEFQEAVKRTVEEYKWKIQLNNKQFFRAFRPWNWSGSWGEMITIIKDKDKLLLNSICDPYKMSSVASYGWNKRNIQAFLKNLLDVKKGIPFQKKLVVPKKEWTTETVAFRLFAYPFCLFLIGFGFYLLVNSLSWNTLSIAIPAMAIALIYLYSDIKMILK